MVYGSWDHVVRMYREVCCHHEIDEQYIVHAEAMLKLIPQIKAEPTFAQVVPFTSHITLCITLPEKRDAHLRIWYDLLDQYRIQMCDSSAGITFDQAQVGADDILPQLKIYLDRLGELRS